MRAAASLFALYDYDLKCIEGRHIKDIFKSSLWVEPNSKRFILLSPPGCVPQSVGHLTRKSEILGSIPGLATYFRFSFR